MASFTKIEFNEDVNITKDKWKELLLNAEVVKKEDLNLFMVMYNKKNYACTGIELEHDTKIKYNTYNLRVGRLGKKIVKYLNLDAPRQRDDTSKFNYWHVMFLGTRDINTKRFVWILRSNIIAAIDELVEEKKITNYYGDTGERLIEITNLENIYLEGSRCLVSVNMYERDSKARNICIQYYKDRNKGKISCIICKFNFEKFYGEEFKNKIHIHHIKPLSSIKKEYKLNPITDLVPVCPNCHMAIHSKKPIYKIEELQEILHKK
ncbi:MAG: HNH endonuclease [Sarcina sp.]